MRRPHRLLLLIAALALPPVLAAAGCGPARPFVLLVVDEANSHALEAAPAEDRREPAYHLDLAEDSLVVADRAMAPGGRTRLLVAYHARGRGVTLVQEVRRADRLPWTLHLTDPLRLEGEVRDFHGAVLGRHNVIDNQQRLVPFDLEFLGVDQEGAVSIRAGDEQIVLRPGDSWLVAFIRDAGGVRLLRWEEDWAAARAAFERGEPVTRLEVLNHGFWERRQVRVGPR
ncbi:MAG TPA: hypothetical protein VLK32_08240 [Bacillota bacterium]|nr:hypothetical protein [Bacillota bacterium]